MVCTALIAVAMGNILVMNVRAARLLQASREVAATSQVLQQRVEIVRDRPWIEVSSSARMALVMQMAADSEAELGNAHFTERLKVTVPTAAGDGLRETSRFFTVSRVEGNVTVDSADDFSAEPTLLLEGTAVWRDSSGVHQRVLRSVVCRYGLTRGGIVGTVLGRPGSRTAQP